MVRGVGINDAVWSPTTFSKNRDRLLTGNVTTAFFDAVLIHADTARLLSDEHFTVDGTLLEAWASQKSFRPRDQEPPVRVGRFHGQRRTHATHASTTDPDARLYKNARGREARLVYLGHVLMEHRSGLIADARVTPADGYTTSCASAACCRQLHDGDAPAAAPGRHANAPESSAAPTDTPEAGSPKPEAAGRRVTLSAAC